MDLECVGFVNADFVGDRNKRRFIIGYVFTKAEYIAAMHACKEAIQLRQLLGELKVKQNMLELHCDIQSALYLARNPLFTPVQSI